MVLVLTMKFLVLFSVLLAFSSLIFLANGGDFGGSLDPRFYDGSCPMAQDIVRSVVAEAVAKEPRMAASLLRLHFHDCFVKGCDASLLLDSSTDPNRPIVSEKGSVSNLNSARGFEVIDQIKSRLEDQCPSTVSCADILTLASRDSVVLVGGWSWEVALGRRDSLNASIDESNRDIPSPFENLSAIAAKFTAKGLDMVDVVALSGSHSIGKARCVTFRRRLYNGTGGHPDPTLDPVYASQLRLRCPESGSGDTELFDLDVTTPSKLDSYYFRNITKGQGLLHSDAVVFSESAAATKALVEEYAEKNEEFLEQFAKSMIKMGNISPLTGSEGEIRKNCRNVN